MDIDATGPINPYGDPARCLSACTNVTAGRLRNVTGISASASEFNVSAGVSSLRITFLSDSVFRVWLAPKGRFSDPAQNEIVLKTDYKPPAVQLTDKGTYYSMRTADVELRLHKSPVLLSLLDAQGQSLWAETEPLQWNTTSTWQTLQQGKDEFFYGCGMQVGYFSHRGNSMLIEEGGGWDQGGRPNPVPFYMSTAGYGVFRNTYSPGQYTFQSPGIFAHNEYRFDGYYFYGPSLKTILGLYTELTGRPFFPPIWGLHLGDSDCYNDAKKNRTTLDAVKVAQGYRDNDMPGGWFLVNDGYGCGYTSRDELVETINDMHSLGFYTGLWTSTGLQNASWEIGIAGSRGIKTDVGWVGDGYKFELDALKLATSLIEGYSNSRRYIWTVCGWAGTHHYAVVW